MTKKIEHPILIGNDVYKVHVEAEIKGGVTRIDIKSLTKAQKDLARQLMREHQEYNVDVFNFVMNVVGERASLIAKILESTPAHISKLRHGEKCSNIFWKLFRITMVSLLSDRRDREIDKLIDENRAA